MALQGLNFRELLQSMKRDEYFKTGRSLVANSTLKEGCAKLPENKVTEWELVIQGIHRMLRLKVRKGNSNLKQGGGSREALVSKKHLMR